MASIPFRLGEGNAIVADVPAPAATAYAAIGFAVFPVHGVDASGHCSCGKTCGRNAGKHPLTPNGLHDATRDLDRITDWWSRWPDANLAVATGAPSGLWVLDVDPDHGGLEALDALEAEHGEIGPTWCVETGGGGLHLWFSRAGVSLRNSVGRLGPGLDVRADGGYVVVPPSLHRSGQPYRWADGWHPTLVALTPAPAWLIALASQAPTPTMIPPDAPPIQRKVGGKHPQPIPDVIAEGARNASLTSLAGAMRRQGASERAIVAALLVDNAERCRPMLGEDEVARIARSVCRYAPVAEPRLVRAARGPRAVEFIDGRAVSR